MCCREEK